MVKADFDRDYYGDLELPASSSEAEIKKQFKKLALKYHPDRNPGREAEVNSKFQTIQSAHEVLTDAAERKRYDAGRRLGGARGGGFGGYSTPSTGSSGMKGNPWSNAGSEWAPPPKHPGTARKPPPSAGASRYTNNFTTPRPTPKPPKPATDAAEERKNNYSAWESMRKEKKTTTSGAQRESGQYYKPSNPAPDHKNYNGREASNAQKHKYPVPPRPGFAEFNAAQDDLRRTPSQRKNGYMPSTSGGDEPPASNSGAYFTRQNPRPVPPIPPGARPAPPPPPDSTRPGRQAPMDPILDEPRLSTPYMSHGGEKTNPFDGINLHRTRSMRDGGNTTGEGNFSTGSGRPRSASPSRFKRQAHESPDLSGVGSDTNLGSPSKKTNRNYTPQPSKAEAKYTPQVNLDDGDSTSSDDTPNVRTQSRPMANPRRSRVQPNRAARDVPPKVFTAEASYPVDESGNLCKPSLGAFREWLAQHEARKVEEQTLRNITAGKGNIGGNNGNKDIPSQYDYPTLYEPLGVSSSANVLSPIFNDRTSGQNFSSFPFSRSSTAWAGTRAADTSDQRMQFEEFSNAEPDLESHQFEPQSAPDRLNAFEAAQYQLLHDLINGAPDGLNLRKLSTEPLKEKILSGHGRTNVARQTKQGSCLTTQGTGRIQHLPPHIPDAAFEVSSKESSNQPLHAIKRQKAEVSSHASRADEERPLYPTKINFTTRMAFSANPRAHRFSSDADGSASSGPRPHNFASSAENINMTFSPEDWHGKFQADYFAAGAESNGTSRSGSRARSPVKRKPFTNSTTANTATNEKPTRMDSQRRESDTTSPGPAKFTAEEWDQTFEPGTFAPSGFPSPGARSRQPRRTRTGSSMKVPPGTAKTGNAAMVPDDEAEKDKPLFDKQSENTASPNAMDLDPAPSARNVPVEPLRAEWRAGDHSTASSNDPSPSATGPPRPPKETIVEEQNDEEDFKTNFDELKNVEPFQNPAKGLGSFSDLTSSLPFTSAAAAKAPIGLDLNTKKLDLPQPPRCPMLPTIPIDSIRPSPTSWDSYLVQFKGYMADWNEFNTKMIAHFYARKNQVENDYRAGWLEAFGDSGVDRYIEGLREDAQVREWWAVAAGKHELAMCDFKWMRGVMKEGVDKAPPRDVEKL